MKPTFTRRQRRRSTTAKTEGAFFKKESQETFFGGAEHETFFHPAVTAAPAQSVQRKCDNCEEDKKVQRAEDKKEEEKKVMKKEDRKEEEKVMKKEEKKEEEKVMKKEDKKEEEKIMKMEDKKEEEKVQKKEAGTSAAPGKSISNYISSLNGKGNPLPAQSNHFFSSKMGYDFSDVKIHNDKEAAESAKAINAKAYTSGKNVVFNEGQFNTASASGQMLMAHELAHVVQQDKKSINGRLHRQPARSFWFKDPANQQPPKAGQIGTSAQAREKVYVEPVLTKVGGSINIRFAYPSSEMTTQPSARINSAKTKIAKAFATIVSDLGSLPDAKDAAEMANNEKVRARLKETLSSKGTFHIFIQSEPSTAELLKGMVAAYANRVYVDLADVGDEKKLQAAISVPLMMLTGGIMPGKGGAATVDAASATQLKDTLLHEALHAMLISRSVDSEAIYLSTAQKRTITGDKTLMQSFELLMSNFMVAQEEVFVYSQIALLYPGGDAKKGDYNTFIKNATDFIKKRKLTLLSITKKIDVAEKVNSKKVDWDITFLAPQGTYALVADDKTSIDFLNNSFVH